MFLEKPGSPELYASLQNYLTVERAIISLCEQSCSVHCHDHLDHEKQGDSLMAEHLVSLDQENASVVFFFLFCLSFLFPKDTGIYVLISLCLQVRTLLFARLCCQG